MKVTICLLFFFIFHTFINGQSRFSKIIIDAETGTPINNAHVYKKNNIFEGTATNHDGRFVFNNVKENDTLIIDHISYVPLSFKISEIENDTILLMKKVFFIQDVEVNDLTTHSLMKKILDSLKLYRPKQVMYLASVISLEYEPDSSQLNILTETITNVYHSKHNRVFFKIIKTRSNAYSKRGEKEFNNSRMVQVASIASDNIFWLKKDDIFHKNKLNSFDIKIISESKYNNYTLLKIKCSRLKKQSNSWSYIFYVYKETYFIKKIFCYNDISNYTIGFKEVKNKQYLDYSIRSKLVKTKYAPPHMYKVMTIYNIDTQTQFDKDNFLSFFKIAAQRLNKYINSWDESFWENYNFIPLPNWVKQKIQNHDVQ